MLHVWWNESLTLMLFGMQILPGHLLYMAVRMWGLDAYPEVGALHSWSQHLGDYGWHYGIYNITKPPYSNCQYFCGRDFGPNHLIPANNFWLYRIVPLTSGTLYLSVPASWLYNLPPPQWAVPIDESHLHSITILSHYNRENIYCHLYLAIVSCSSCTHSSLSMPPPLCLVKIKGCGIQVPCSFHQNQKPRTKNESHSPQWGTLHKLQEVHLALIIKYHRGGTKHYRNIPHQWVHHLT